MATERALRAGLLIAVLLWPAWLASALADRLDGHSSVWSATAYLTASHVCHQQPARSFQTLGHPWPVCARCTGLYLAAPFGAWLILTRFGRARRLSVLLVLAATTAVMGLSWVVEVAGVSSVGNGLRALTAAPLGAAVGFTVVYAASSNPPNDRID